MLMEKTGPVLSPPEPGSTVFRSHLCPDPSQGVARLRLREEGACSLLVLAAGSAPLLSYGLACSPVGGSAPGQHENRSLDFRPFRYAGFLLPCNTDPTHSLANTYEL